MTKKPPSKTRNRSVNYLSGFWLALAGQSFKSIWRWWHKPHELRISKKKIIIGLYILWTLLPISNKNHIVYSDPLSPVPQITIPKPLKPIPQTTLSDAEAVSEVPVAPVVTYTAPVVPSVFSGSGDQYLDFIVAHESGGNAFAVNPSSGACGLAQELPCGKSGCTLGDANCELNWMRQYCIDRYGSTYNAYLYWIAHGNY